VADEPIDSKVRRARFAGGRIVRGSEGLESEPSRRRRLIYLARGDRQLLFLTMPADINSQTFCRDTVVSRISACIQTESWCFHLIKTYKYYYNGERTGKIIYISTKGVVVYYHLKTPQLRFVLVTVSVVRTMLLQFSCGRVSVCVRSSMYTLYTTIVIRLALQCLTNTHDVHWSYAVRRCYNIFHIL